MLFGMVHGFGATAAAEPGVCPPHPSHKPTPLTKVRRLQNALRSLAKRVSDTALVVKADGLIGPHTVAATNRALATYAPGFTSGGFTKAQIVRLASQIAAYLEKAPYSTPAAAAAAAPVLAPPPAMIPSQQASAPDTAPAPEGSAMPPYSQPGYYPPNYYPPRGPGGLPTNRATVDVKAFIPAQYEHVQINPGTAMLVIGLGVAVTLLLTKEKRAKKAA